MSEFCTNCGGMCCGKLKIEITKGCYHPFCSGCFYLFGSIKITEIRKILKNNKRFVIIK